MDEKAFQTKLHELIREIEMLPTSEKGSLENLATKTEATHKELAQTARNLTETLDTLRLQIKYLVFDLEATRRENRYLRKMLETRPRREGDDIEE